LTIEFIEETFQFCLEITDLSSTFVKSQIIQSPEALTATRSVAETPTRATDDHQLSDVSHDDVTSLMHPRAADSDAARRRADVCRVSLRQRPVRRLREHSEDEGRHDLPEWLSRMSVG
jgi:hypothetical protein